MRNTFDLSVYFVLDPSLCAGRNYLDVAHAAVRGGASMVQLRDKSGDRDKVVHHANNLKPMCAQYKVPFIVNDYVDVALEAGADGVHLGQGDGDPAEARAKLGEHAIIGLTAFEPVHFEMLDRTIVDYAGTGPVYSTKTDKGKPVLGLENFSNLVDCSPVPVVGIGGITPDNAPDVINAGADGVAMMRSISEAEDIENAAYRFLNVVAAARLQEVS